MLVLLAELDQFNEELGAPILTQFAALQRLLTS